MENAIKSDEFYEGKIIAMGRKKNKEVHKPSEDEDTKKPQQPEEVEQAASDETDDAQNSASGKDVKIDQKQMEFIITKVVHQIKPELKSMIAVSLLPIIIPVAIAVIGGVCGAVAYLHTEFSSIKVDIASLKKDVSHIQEDVTEIQGSVSNLDTEIEKISDYLYGNNGVEDQLEGIHNVLNTIPIATTDSISGSDELSIKKNDVSTTTASLSADSVLGNDVDGNEYLVKDFVRQTVLLTYNEGNSEVYFRGQYNENYRWDGYCVTNVYDSNGILTGICESNFDDGKRLDYKSFYPEETAGQWICTNRVCTDSGNSGSSTEYTFSYDKVKNFTSSNVRITDFLYVDKFVNSNPMKVASYYSGETSGGVYNDLTGDAYKVIYNDDGTVRTLYKGQFVSGKFEDYSGNAWDIAYSEDEMAYFYNTGNFENDSAVNKSDKPVSIEEIQSIINPFHFECELKWRQ